MCVYVCLCNMVSISYSGIGWVMGYSDCVLWPGSCFVLVLGWCVGGWVRGVVL